MTQYILILVWNGGTGATAYGPFDTFNEASRARNDTLKRLHSTAGAMLPHDTVVTRIRGVAELSQLNTTL